MSGYILTARTWLDKSRRRVAPDGSPAAAHLLGVAGDEIPEEQARMLGLLPVTPPPAADPESDPEPTPAPEQPPAPVTEAKKVAGPPEDKSASGLPSAIRSPKSS